MSRTRIRLLGWLALAGGLAACANGGGSSLSGSLSGSGGTSQSSSSSSMSTPLAHTSVLTYKYDVSRSGANLTETVLTPTNVNSASFGLLRNLVVDGNVDAQPLYLSGLTIGGTAHNVLFVATENDSLYAFDADTGTMLWHVSLAPSGEVPSDDHGCSQITPTIGITATPVIDPSAGAHGTLFAVATTKDAASAYHHRVHALDVTSGAELPASPVSITATFGATSFDPAQYAERAGLLLANGTLYTAWTSHCDAAPYGGWVIAYAESTLAQVAALNVAPLASGSGFANQGPAIWMAGGGLAADSTGNVYFLTGNGRFDTTLNGGGFPSGGDYGNSFVKVATAAGALSVSDYFTMSNEVSESTNDTDLGSGGVMLLPDLQDSGGTVHHLAVGAGKDGNLYVVNRDSMGEFNAASDNIYEELDGVLSGGIYSTPAYFNGTLYYGPVGGSMLAFAVSNARIASSPSSQTGTSFVYPGTAPVVSANGTTNAIVWAYENAGTAVLHAYDAGNLATELYNSNQAANGRDQFGAGNKFIAPVVADGKVFVASTNSVAVFGLLP